MSKPIVAIVGRPNVGKSTFFNYVVGRRISIVEDTPGVTRDRVYADTEWMGRAFTLVDTGGIEPMAQDVILSQMRAQARIAVETADVILFFVDGREGLMPADDDVAKLLRRAKKPLLLVVNKVDAFRPAQVQAQADFYALGLGEPICISSANKLGLGDLLDEIVRALPPAEEESAEEGEAIRVAVVGKPNAGKSSLVNRLLGEERVIVSDIPGTTRDAVDTPLEADGQRFMVIDTAGIRRKSRIEEGSIERYGVIRSLAAVRRSDVVLLLLDAESGVTEQDARIAGYAEEEGKACVIVVNKWDLIEKDTHTMDQFKKRIRSDLAFVSYAPILFISAKTGQRAQNVLGAAVAAVEQARRRITTGQLNDALGEALRITEPPTDKGRRLKIYYATQVSVAPPTMLLFVNDPSLMHFSYQRYLENQFRKTFGFEGTPLRFILRARSEKGE